MKFLLISTKMQGTMPRGACRSAGTQIVKAEKLPRRAWEQDKPNRPQMMHYLETMNRLVSPHHFVYIYEKQKLRNAKKAPETLVKMQTHYITSWRKRFARYEMESREMAEQARRELEKAIDILEKYGATRIVLFGSLCRGIRFDRQSDIDLAVEGIPSKKFFRASADLMMELDWPVDLKPWEELDDFFRKMIIKTGEVLYEKQERTPGSGRGNQG